MKCHEDSFLDMQKWQFILKKYIGGFMKAMPLENKRMLLLYIQIYDIEPPIYRRLLIRNSVTFMKLHNMIQLSFGWKDYHFFAFDLNGIEIIIPDPDVSKQRQIGLDPRTVRLGDYLQEVNEEFTYTYDFGDDWIHSIKVEQILPFNPNLKAPICLEGKRAAPPEDSHGPHYYPEILNAVKKKKGELYEWIKETNQGRDFDPEDFRIETVNGLMSTSPYSDK